MIWSLLFLPLVPTFFRFLFACHGSLINLRSTEDYVILPFSPTDLSVADIVLVLCVFIGRSIRKALGYGHVHKVGTSPRQSEQSISRLQATDSKRSEDDALVHLQGLELAMPLHIRSSDIAQYIKTISSNPLEANKSNSPAAKEQYTNDILTSDQKHLTLFFSAISEPALLLLLARKGCPIEPLGSVNARNHFRLLRPDLCKQIIKEAELTPAKSQSTTSPTLSPGASKDQTLENSVLASLPPSARPVKRGLEIDITVSIYTRVKDPQTQTWGPNTEVFRQVFTVLQFTKSLSSKTTKTAQDPTSAPTIDPNPDPTSNRTSTPNSNKTTTTVLALSKSDPLEWAKLSKDYNPIHISTFAARAFGFKSVIAHGNHVVAKALNTLPVLLRDDPRDLDGAVSEKGIYMNIAFKRPVLVPSEVRVRLIETTGEGEERKTNGEDGEERRLRIEVFKGEKVNTEIEIGSLSMSVTAPTST